MLYDLVSRLLAILTRVFFRDIKIRGSHYIPKEGSCIFVVAPHANQLIDPIMVLQSAGRRVGFLSAAKTVNLPYVGKIAKALNAIPVVRAQDLIRDGPGSIYIEENATTNTIKGHNTKFLADLEASSILVIKGTKISLRVATVISDTEVTLSNPITESNVLELLSANKDQGVGYNIIPHVDQSVVYKAVYDRLNAGECIGIFPEGGSHDRSEILPLKAGVTIMALSAMANNPDLDVKIIPTGLHYFNPDRFRSRACVEFGHPITISSELVEQYKLGGEEKRKACGTLLETIHTALRGVTVNAPDYETLQVIQAIRRFFKPKDPMLILIQKLDLTRSLVKGYIKYGGDERIKVLKQRILEYNMQLNHYGLKDHQVGKTDRDAPSALILLLLRTMYLVILTPLVLPGFILSCPALYLTRAYSKQKAKEALAASSVKITGKDVIGTWKILAAMVVLPSLYFIYSCLVALWLNYRGVSSPFNWLVPILTFLLLPIMSYIGVKIFESGIEVYRSLNPLILAILPSSRSPAEQLRKMRSEIQKSVNDVIYDLGPDFLPDFQQRMSRYIGEASNSIINDSSEEEEEEAEEVEKEKENQPKMNDPSTRLPKDLLPPRTMKPSPLDTTRRVSSWVQFLHTAGDTYFTWEENQQQQGQEKGDRPTPLTRRASSPNEYEFTSHVVLPVNPHSTINIKRRGPGKPNQTD